MHPKLIICALTCALAALAAPHLTHARSVFNNIPGLDLVRDLSRNVLDTVNDLVDGGITSLGSEISALNPTFEGLTECLDSKCESLASKDPDSKRNVSQIIQSRGFGAEEYDVITRDGYILTIQRIINPLVDEQHRIKLKPVILQHGLMSSSVDWVINSVLIQPEKYPPQHSSTSGKTLTYSSLVNRRDSLKKDSTQAVSESKKISSTSGVSDADSSNSIEGHQSEQQEQHLPGGDSQEHPNSLGFYLANRGYDVWLANSRGNIYGQRHKTMSSWLPKFWDFTFDEQIKFDLPDIIQFIQDKTKQTKVGYVGHSQGTTMIFGLLADQPEFADIIEPVVALAPVAYTNHCLSPVRHFAAYSPLFAHINMWFGSSNVAVRYLAPKVCGPEVIRKEICANIIFLSCGFDEAEFDESRVEAYLSHMPSGTSVKNIAHWGQLVQSGKFQHFDHGILGNQVEYGHAEPPQYDLGKIRSKSISLFTAENDWLASPKDVARLKAELRVPLFRTVNITESVPKWNHIDFVYGKDCGRLVNTQVVDIFDHFK